LQFAITYAKYDTTDQRIERALSRVKPFLILTEYNEKRVHRETKNSSISL